MVKLNEIFRNTKMKMTKMNKMEMNKKTNQNMN